MSTKGQILNIQPPLDNKESEVHSFNNITCPNCNGCGKISFFEDYFQLGEPDTEPCQRCNASGKLTAKVVVKWQAE